MVILGIIALCAAPGFVAESPVASVSSGDSGLETSRPMRSMQHVSLTVGQSEGDLQGKDDKIIQSGIDYLNRLGGGTLRILPGTYELRNAIYLHPHITLCGSGENTILRKSASVATPLVRESDWYEYGVKVADPQGFSLGGGIILQSQPESGGGLDVLLATITAIQGNFIFLDRRTEKNFWLSGRANASTIFPILTAEYVDDVSVHDIVLEGNRTENGYLNGNYTGAVFLQYCNRWNFKNVIARNYNGDGFSFQVCDDIQFQNCQSLNNTDRGFHPGSGSQRPVFRNCIAKQNNEGIFFCWGVTYGLAEDCILSENKKFGINFGHRDTDNVIQNCTIERNGEVGIVFRQETPEFRNGNRNRIEHCVLRDNGNGTEGIGIDIQSTTQDIVICNSRIENTKPKDKQIGVRIGIEAKRIDLQNNTILNYPIEILDLRQMDETKTNQ